ncbi:WhiB family transcriptional regulator [Streptomyces sp. NPDC002888]|uniref:WhiB family transcriptional regulator n=1 Tax=Streptomyces sp. NPDC002888 TaxID=3364668 RepID=UPI0036820A98
MPTTGPRGHSDPPDPSHWHSAAACAGLPPRVVFSRRPAEAAPALRACAVCPVRRPCEEAVAPADSGFDGVCAGRLWRSGRPVPTPAPTRSAPRSVTLSSSTLPGDTLG